MFSLPHKRILSSAMDDSSMYNHPWLHLDEREVLRLSDMSSWLRAQIVNTTRLMRASICNRRSPIGDTAPPIGAAEGVLTIEARLLRKRHGSTARRVPNSWQATNLAIFNEAEVDAYRAERTRFESPNIASGERRIDVGVWALLRRSLQIIHGGGFVILVPCYYVII